MSDPPSSPASPEVPSLSNGTTTTTTTSSSSSSSNPPSSFLGRIQQHPYITAGAGVALVVHLAALLSLPPAIRGKGAPYLPTTASHSKAMFDQLKQQLLISSELKDKAANGSLCFVDLGSGDGRLVFQAAGEGIFRKSIGYEVNPVLHTFAHTRRLLQAPKYWTSTQFTLQDIWKVNLQDVNVVAVYGLTPIMKKLGIKLRTEMQPGSIVLSNVFSIPGWQPVSTSRQGTHIYVVPDKEVVHGSGDDQVSSDGDSLDFANVAETERRRLS